MLNDHLASSSFVGFVLLVFAAADPALAQEPVNTHEWPQYRGNAGFTGVSSDASVKPLNRALVYDPIRDLVFLVLGANDRSQSQVYTRRFRQEAGSEK